MEEFTQVQTTVSPLSRLLLLPQTGIISSDQNTGSYLVAVLHNGGIYYSVNGGSSWAVSNAPSGSYHSVSSSLSGQFVYASVGCFGSCAGFVYVSSDYGATWLSDGAPSGLSFDTIATSGDGSLVLAGAYGNGLYLGAAASLPSAAPTLHSPVVPSPSPSGRPSQAPTARSVTMLR